jgi:dTDP-4-amino-4,6-dideoxygalactose transaminase
VKVEFVNVAAQTSQLRAEIDAALADVLSTGAFILGPNVQALEKEIAALEGATYGVALNSGTDALILPLLAAGIGPGDEVITSPFTFVANVEAICIAGATPVFADIDDATFNIDPAKIAGKITPRTKAILPVHLFGQMADMKSIESLAKAHNLIVIGDGAQAIDAAQDGKPMGSFGACATLSFYPTKNLGACGDGGMIVTSSEEMFEALKLLRFHGSGGGYTYKRVGFNSRLDEMQAAILRVKLRRLREWNEARRANAAIYDQILGQCDDIATPGVFAGNRHVYHVYTIRVKAGPEKRDALKAHLAEREIGSSIFYHLSLHLQEAYRYLGYNAGDMPVSERVTSEVLSLPIHSHLSREQVEFAAESVVEFFA